MISPDLVLDHVGEHGAAQAEHTVHVDGQHLVPYVGIALHHFSRIIKPGIGEKNVNAPETGQAPLKPPAQLRQAWRDQREEPGFQPR